MWDCVLYSSIHSTRRTSFREHLSKSTIRINTTNGHSWLHYYAYILSKFCAMRTFKNVNLKFTSPFWKSFVRLFLMCHCVLCMCAWARGHTIWVNVISVYFSVHMKKGFDSVWQGTCNKPAKELIFTFVVQEWAKEHQRT